MSREVCIRDQRPLAATAPVRLVRSSQARWLPSSEPLAQKQSVAHQHQHWQ